MNILMSDFLPHINHVCSSLIIEIIGSIEKDILLMKIWANI